MYGVHIVCWEKGSKTKKIHDLKYETGKSKLPLNVLFFPEDVFGGGTLVAGPCTFVFFFLFFLLEVLQKALPPIQQ